MIGKMLHRAAVKVDDDGVFDRLIVMGQDRGQGDSCAQNFVAIDVHFRDELVNDLPDAGKIPLRIFERILQSLVADHVAADIDHDDGDMVARNIQADRVFCLWVVGERLGLAPTGGLEQSFLDYKLLLLQRFEILRYGRQAELQGSGDVLDRYRFTAVKKFIDDVAVNFFYFNAIDSTRSQRVTHQL